ncbi:MAG: prenyltransferase/squalene oxidase repeat-containing protein [Gemmataceae bacterium]
MMTRLTLTSVIFLAGCGFAFAQEKPDKKTVDTAPMIEKGLEWLKRSQAGDGHWEAQGGQYPTTMTALSGMAMLMEGSTLHEGKYSDNLVKAVNWFLQRSDPRSGVLGNLNNPTENSRYMYGHGFGLMFLACVYGEEDDVKRRKELEVVLKRAVEFCCKAQTTQGGWGYVTAKDGGDFDEGSVTITQLQALRAARNAGIPVPKATIDKSIEYLRKCTTDRGGIIYSLGNGAGRAMGGERPPLTAAAVACSFSAGQYNDEYAKKWIKYCKENIPVGVRGGHDEYQSYYLAQSVYVLGENRYGEMFPKENKESWLVWSKYRESMFEYLKSNQMADGSWNGGYVGPAFGTSVALTILQLENNILPIYHR